MSSEQWVGTLWGPGPQPLRAGHLPETVFPSELRDKSPMCKSWVKNRGLLHEVIGGNIAACSEAR